MRFYRLDKITTKDGHAGSEWFTSFGAASDARRAFMDMARNDGAESNITPIDIEPTKTSILRALNRYASHPDNG